MHGRGGIECRTSRVKLLGLLGLACVMPRSGTRRARRSVTSPAAPTWRTTGASGTTGAAGTLGASGTTGVAGTTGAAGTGTASPCPYPDSKIAIATLNYDDGLDTWPGRRW
jgi:hypothetical protein